MKFALIVQLVTLAYRALVDLLYAFADYSDDEYSSSFLTDTIISTPMALANFLSLGFILWWAYLRLKNEAGQPGTSPALRDDSAADRD